MVVVIDKIKSIVDWGMDIYNKLLALTFHLPYVKVDRNKYLSRELKPYCSDADLKKALEGKPTDVLDKSTIHKIANKSILRHCIFTSLLSAIAVIPGNTVVEVSLMVMDLLQFQLIVFIIAQKIIYLYGHDAIKEEKGEEKAAAIILTVSAVMIGSHQITQKLKSAAGTAARRVVMQAAAKTGSRAFIINIVKQLLKWLGIDATKATLLTTLSLAVNCLCMLISGLVSFWLLYPMCKRLTRHLEEENDKEIENGTV